MFKRICLVLVLTGLLTAIAPTMAIDEVEDSRGQIAIVGADYNIYTYTMDDAELTQLTDDAQPSRRYQWVTWSNDGRLAYFCCDGNPMGQAYISADGLAQPELAYENPGTFVIYAYWSPADCGQNCRELAMLVNSSSGLAVDILQDSDAPTTTTIGTGGPFYYHWNSTGTQMILHRGNRDLDVYNRADNDITEQFAPSSGLFQAPVWSPIDNRILIAFEGTEAGRSDLAIIDGNDINVLAQDLEGLLSFLWSPDGQYIAYRTRDQFGYSGLTVLDATTGDVIQTADSRGAIGFFWSPDSNKIAYITIEDDAARSAKAAIRVNQTFVQDDSPTRFSWNVLDIEAESNVRYSSFIPTYEFIYLLQYFDQFAPSHRIWSPDSQYLVFSGGVDNNQSTPIIYTLDTTSATNQPQMVAEGVFGVWSFK